MEEKATPKIKLLFLDIDGVLNNDAWYKQYPQWKDYNLPDRNIDPSCIKKINTILTATNAKIVISSTWRHQPDVNEKLYKCGLLEDSIIGITPNYHHSNKHALRGNEIHGYIDINKELIGCFYWEYKNYVILDDDNDMLLWQKDNFVLVDRIVGISDYDVERSIKILNS